MTPELYKQLHAKVGTAIHAKRQAGLARLEAELEGERKRLYQSLADTWFIANGTEPPPISSNNNGRPAERVINRDGQSTKNDKIRAIIREFQPGDEVDTQRVFQRFVEAYPDSADELTGKTTIISKVFRELVQKGELILEKKAYSNFPALFRKV